MPRKTRAILFDLDDTLYPLDQFVLSGFDAVAAYLAVEHGVDGESARSLLRYSFHHGSRGRELQACVRQFRLSESLVPSLVQIIRRHAPDIALPTPTARVLRALAPTWRIGVVTNGTADIQSRKVAALGLAGCVDTVVFADGDAKPAAAPFLEAAERLQIGTNRAVFVGNDPVCDVFGAWRLGMKTIHVADRSAAVATALMADATVRSLSEVPDIAERLVA